MVYPVEHITERLPTRITSSGYRLNTYITTMKWLTRSRNYLYVKDPHFHAVPHDLGLSMDAIIDFKLGMFVHKNRYYFRKQNLSYFIWDVIHMNVSLR